MKIVRFATENYVEFGIMEADGIRRITGDIYGEFEPSNELVELRAARLLCPCAPTKIIALGRNYAAHAAEHGAQVPTEPLLFFKPPSAVIGPGTEIVYSAATAQLEYEGELAVVIKKRGKDIREENAAEYILGYTCANDVTARDLQRKDSQWTRAKGFDTFAPLGPCIETELDPAALQITTEVNGKVVQQGNTRDMVFKIPFILRYISEIMTLEPGDVIMTGTPEGVGRIERGDTVAVTIPGIGILENVVAV